MPLRQMTVEDGRAVFIDPEPVRDNDPTGCAAEMLKLPEIFRRAAERFREFGEDPFDRKR
jgi:hypothetical protein